MRVPPNATSWQLMTMPPLTAFLKLADASLTLSVVNTGQRIRCNSNTIPPVITIPAQDNGQASWLDLDTIDIEQVGPGYLTIQPAPGVSLNSPVTSQAHLVGQKAAVKLIRVGVDDWILHGELDRVHALQAITAPAAAFAALANLNNTNPVGAMLAVIAAGLKAFINQQLAIPVAQGARALIAAGLGVDNTRVTTTSGN